MDQSPKSRSRSWLRVEWRLPRPICSKLNHALGGDLIMKTWTQVILSLLAASVVHSVAQAQSAEIYCTIRDNGGSLNCQWMGAEKKVMNAEDVSNFIDSGNVAAYVTLKSRKGMERTF